MVSHAAEICELNGKATMVVYGGTGIPFGLNLSSEIYLCDLSSDFLWTIMEVKVAAPPKGFDGVEGHVCHLPKQLCGQAVVIDNHHFYTIGGTSGFNYFMDVHRLNMRDQTWELVHKGNDRLDATVNRNGTPAPR